MGDNSMYWPDQSGWYQQPTGHPPPPPPYQSGSYPTGPNIHNDHNHTSTPPPPIQQQQHSHHTQQQQQQQQHLSQQQSQHHLHHQPQPQMHHHQMLPNGMSNGNHHHNLQSTIPGQQQSSVPNQQQPQVGPSMNHYNQPPPQQQQQQQQQPPPPPPQTSHLNNMHHEPLSNQQAQMQQQQQQQQQLDSSNNYQMHQPSYQAQVQQTPHPPPPQTQQTQNQMYAQSNSYPGMMNVQSTSNPHHPAMQQPQHQQQQPYPQQQYSPPSYWNHSAHMQHNQPNYGPPPPPPQQQQQQPPPPPNAAQTSTPGIPTPPTSIQDSTSNYHHAGSVPQQQPPPQIPGIPPSNMPYESRGSNMTANYNTPPSNYHQSGPGYYTPHDTIQPQAEPILSYDVNHPQTNPQQQTWSNGYYQPSQPSYTNVMNPYQTPYNGAVPNQPPAPMPAQGPPQIQHLPQPPQYPHHSAPQPQWAPQNHAMPIPHRNKTGDKKPVKPRAPKKQSNPNAPTGRRKRPFMTEEHKQSGYAKFYQIKRKELSTANFADVSKQVAELWARLSAEEKNLYVKDVSIKRKEMLKKKASQQAQDLLVQGTKQEH